MSRACLSGRASLAGRFHLLAFVAATALLALVFGSQPAGSDAATAPDAKQESRGAPAGETGKLIAKYSTANSDTYELPDGHMLTRVFSKPEAVGAAMQALAPGGALSSPASETTPGATPALATQGSGSGTDELSCTIDKSTPTTSECNAATFRAGYEPTTQQRPVHGLLQFALPNLDNNVTVLNAKLELYETASTTTSEVALTASTVLGPWGAGVTWNTSNGSTPWETPGGDYVQGNNADAAPAEAGTATGWHYWYPTEVLQKWLNGTGAPRDEGQPNLGLLIGEETEGSVNNIVSFAGNGHTDAPALTFEWIQRGIGSASNYTMLPVPVSASASLEVNAASGNLMAKSSDLTIASKGTPFDVARIFNSLAPEQFGYGAGWADVNTPHIEVNPNGSVRYVSASGNTFVFDRAGLNEGKPAGLRPPPQLASGPEEAVMCENATRNTPCPKTVEKGATYELWYLKSELMLFFKGTSGTIYPFAVEYVGNEPETPSYTTGKVLPTSWTDSAKEAITYTESATLGYTKVAYEAKKESVTYTEKADAAKVNKLVEVTNAAKEKTTYTYGSGTEEGLLTKIEEPAGVHVTITYDSEKQVAKIVTASTTEHPIGSTTTYTYYEVGKAPSPCTASQKATVVTESGGSGEPSLTYCSNVLDEVEQVAGYRAVGQAGGYLSEGEPVEEPTNVSVDLASGNLSLQTKDLEVEREGESEGEGMVLERFYNSQGSHSVTSLGSGWSWGTGPSVYLVNYGGSVVIHGRSGYTISLPRVSESTYSSPGEFEGTLTKNTNGTFTLTDADGPIYQFNAAGVLSSETPEAGEAQTVSDSEVNGVSALHEITGTGGKYFEVGYSAAGRVESVKGSAGEGHYGYNAGGQLSSYTSPAGAKTEYGYNEAGYLDKITTAEQTETIAFANGKVSEVVATPVEGAKTTTTYTYETPQSPTCNPASDAGETVLTSTIEGEEEPTSQAYCYNQAGEFTGPKDPEAEAEVEEGSETPPEVPANMCTEDPELHENDCSLEEGAPEEAQDLYKSDYGLSDNNWLQPRVVEKTTHPHFDYLSQGSIVALHVKKYRRVIPWNMVSEAEHNEELPGDNEGASALLADVEEWIKRVKEAGAVPTVAFEDLCPTAKPWASPGKLKEKDTHKCSEAPTQIQYKEAVEKFLKSTTHPILGEVQYFEALNEPNNRAVSEGEHIKPTYSETGEAYPKGPNGAYLAGEYWRVLDDLCATSVRKAEKRPECYVAAGDFSDSEMNPWNPQKHGYPYIQQYLDGMGKPEKAYRWSWHAYTDGEETQTRYKNEPKKWWKRFHLFEKLIDHVSEHSKYKDPKIWLSEQGVVYSNNKEYKEKEPMPVAWRKQGASTYIMHAFVEHGSQQLTRQLNPGSKESQITRFFYYSTRGEPVFDSGLLEAEKLPIVTEKKVKKEAIHKYKVNHPREIYGIFRKKTPDK